MSGSSTQKIANPVRQFIDAKQGFVKKAFNWQGNLLPFLESMTPEYILPVKIPTQEEYRSKQPTVQQSYVGAILSEAGANAISYNIIHFVTNGMETGLVESFFKNFPDFSPETSLGKLIQLVASEESLRIRCSKDPKDNFTGLRRRPPKKEDQDSVEKSITEAQLFFSNKIFGESQAEGYLNRVRTAFLAHRSEGKDSSGCKKRKERNEQLAQLIKEINTRFPLTSR